MMRRWNPFISILYGERIQGEKMKVENAISDVVGMAI